MGSINRGTRRPCAIQVLSWDPEQMMGQAQPEVWWWGVGVSFMLLQERLPLVGCPVPLHGPSLLSQGRGVRVWVLEPEWC